MLLDVPKADVVIVNPTHYAVALKWSRARGSAPVCVAKGEGEVALRIREVAEHRRRARSTPTRPPRAPCTPRSRSAARSRPSTTAPSPPPSASPTGCGAPPASGGARDPGGLRRLAGLLEARKARDLARLEALVAEDRRLAAELAELAATPARDQADGQIWPSAPQGLRHIWADQRIRAARRRRTELRPPRSAPPAPRRSRASASNARWRTWSTGRTTPRTGAGGTRRARGAAIGGPGIDRPRPVRLNPAGVA